MNECIYVKECEGCTITINPKKCSKVVIERTKKCSILIKSILVSSQLEIINSDEVNVTVEKTEKEDSYITIQCDKSTNSNITFVPFENVLHGVTILSSSESLGNTVTLPDFEKGKGETKKHDIIIDKDSNSLQHRSTINIKANSVITTPIIREGVGYITTAAEKKVNDERQALFEKKIEQTIGEMISSSKKPEKEKEKPKMTNYKVFVKTVNDLEEAMNQLTEEEKKKGIEMIKRVFLQEKPQLKFNSIESFDKSKLNHTETKEKHLGDVMDLNAKDEKIFSKSREVELKEHFDDPETLHQEAKKIAKLIKESKHLVVYTGAGISTSANIPDYRGPNGVWTLAEKGIAPEGLNIDQAFPTYSHYALVELMKKGYLKFVVSTNVDGLHRRSGIPKDNISELHGNCYKEYCSKCQKEYLRYFDTTKTVQRHWEHLTGRVCEDEKCKGNLKDTIIHFGENLPVDEFEKALKNSKECDLALVLGTSMKVRPACDLPMVNCGKSKKGDLVICNLQITSFDDLTNVRVFAKTDEFMKVLMKELDLVDFDQTFDGNSKFVKK